MTWCEVDELVTGPTPVPSCLDVSYRNGDRTSGPWATEAETLAAFDERLARLDRWFVVKKEVSGFLTRPRLHQEAKGLLRIDRLLTPTRRLIDWGWTLGPVGVECKRPGTSTGAPIAQLLDYANCVFDAGDGFWIVPQWHFLFPLKTPIGGPVESVLMQHRLGAIHMREGRDDLIFWSGHVLAKFDSEGDLIRLGKATHGRLTGSR